jgi:hypothetical protein
LPRILELVTVNIAVASLDDTAPRWEALGLAGLPRFTLGDPPALVHEISFPLPAGGNLSLIESSEPGSPVDRFLARRPPGLFSLTVRVDDIAGFMRDHTPPGAEWLYDEPIVEENAKAIRYRVERCVMNWLKPAGLSGLLLEVFEFQGEVVDLAA